MRKKYKIAQIGSFDVENYGDLLFPTVLKSKLSECSVDLFSPDGGVKPFEEDVIVYKIKDLEKHCLEKKYDAIIIGGGDLIRVDSSVVPTYEQTVQTSLLLWQLPILIGKKYNIPIIFNCPGVPFEFKECERSVVKQILKDVDYLTVRDENSKNILLKCGLENVKVVPDSILDIDSVIKPFELEKIKRQLERNKVIPKLKKYIVIQHNKININNDNYIENLKKLIDLIINKYKYDVVLMPIGYVHNDIDFLEKLYDKKNKKITIIRKKLSPYQMLSIVSGSSGYIGTSMHGSITSYVYEKPILVINGFGLVKTNGFLKSVNKENVEITDINNIIDVFENNFFTKENVSDRKLIKSKINEHFKKMKFIIENKKDVKESSIDYEFSIIKESFSSFSKVKENDLDNFNVYFDYGKGYSEYSKRIVKINKEGKFINFNLDIPSKIKQIRIDPFEGSLVKFKNLVIKSKDRNLDFYIPDCYEDEDNNYILSIDPNVYVDIDSSIEKIDVNMEIEILSINDVVLLLNRLTDVIREQENNLSLYKGLYEKTFGYKIKRFLKKLY